MTVAEDDGDAAADDPATLSARSRVECAASHSLARAFQAVSLSTVLFNRVCFDFIMSPFSRSLKCGHGRAEMSVGGWCSRDVQSQIKNTKRAPVMHSPPIGR